MWAKTSSVINSLAPERCGDNSKSKIFQLIIQKLLVHLWDCSQMNATEYLWWHANIVAKWHQAITWANADPDLCRQMASLCHNELTCHDIRWHDLNDTILSVKIIQSLVAEN